MMNDGNVTETSKHAQHETAKLRASQRQRILAQIALDGSDGSCITDIAFVMDMEKSSVSARFNFLKKIGKIIFVGKRQSKTGSRKIVEHWRIASEAEHQAFLLAKTQSQRAARTQKDTSGSEAGRTLARLSHRKRKNINQLQRKQKLLF